MKFIYYLSALGSPNLNIKLDILVHNLKYIYLNTGYSFDLMMNCYDTDPKIIKEYLYKNDINFLDKILIHNKKGMLVELWFSNPYHYLLEAYDYILYNMDDVRIINLDLHKLIKIKNKYNIEFLSPKILKSTHSYMNNLTGNILAYTSEIEIYMLLLNYTDFNKFMSINDINNPHTWGVNLTLGYNNIKSAIYYGFEVLHELPSTTNCDVALLDMTKYFNKLGFIDREDFINKHPKFFSQSLINSTELFDIFNTFIWEDYILLNKDLSHITTKEQAEKHWLKKGKKKMRLCNKKQLDVTNEFGNEVILYIPYYYYLYKNDLLFDNKITTYIGMKDFYYFMDSNNIIETSRKRKWIRFWQRNLIVNNLEHVQHFDYQYWIPPPYKEIYKNNILKYNKPLLVIHNKYNIEWGKPPINFIDVKTLDKLFEMLSINYQIVYIRPSNNTIITSYSLDENVFKDELNDYELINDKYKDTVILFNDLLKKYPEYCYNKLLLMLYSNCENYVSIQGGSSHLITYFFKNMLVLHKKGDELNTSYDGWYTKVNNNDKNIRICEYEDMLINNLNIFNIEKSSEEIFIENQVKFMYGKYYGQNNILVNLKETDIIIKNIINDPYSISNYTQNHKRDQLLLKNIVKYWKKDNTYYIIRADWNDNIEYDEFIIGYNRKINTNASIIFPLDCYHKPADIYRKDIIDFKDKPNKLVWRGSTTGSDNINNNLRYKYISKNFQVHSDIDIGFCKYLQNVYINNKELFDKYYKSPIKNDEQCKQYKFILNLEGNDVASSFPWALASNCCPLHNYPFNWESYLFGKGLKPYIHFVPVNNDGTDLLQQYEWCLQNLDKCEEIANNGKKYMEQYLDNLLYEKVMKRFIQMYPLKIY
jgi:hypothetical protein